MTIHSIMSTELSPAQIGGKCDLLVCEIVDDLLLGESVLTTVADARRRLLRSGATILPQGGALWAVPVEWLPPRRADLDLSDLHALVSSMVLTAQPNDSVKLQQHEPHCKQLAPPIRLLSFDWAEAPLATLTRTSGESGSLPLHIERDGTLSAFLVYLTLDLDGDPVNVISTGPDRREQKAWDQSARHLPVPLSVRAGDELRVSAQHTDCFFQTIRVGGYSADMLRADLGLPHLVANPSAQGLTVAMEAPRRRLPRAPPRAANQRKGK